MTPSTHAELQLRVPDLGEAHDVAVIDVLVKPGDRVEVDTPLVTLESDKATMDVPATAGGTVGEVFVKTGDKVSTGAVIATLVLPAATGEAADADRTSSQARVRTPSSASLSAWISSGSSPSGYRRLRSRAHCG